MDPTMPSSGRAPGAWLRRAILGGGLLVGTLDITDAFVYWGLHGAGPARVLQSIAAGLLGRAAARAGGLPTAALGLFLHFLIATTIVAVYLAASRRLRPLVRHPFAGGAVYGVLVFAVMHYVVIPLSAIGPLGTIPLDSLLNQLAIHAFGIGVPSALAARWYDRRSRTEAIAAPAA